MTYHRLCLEDCSCSFLGQDADNIDEALAHVQAGALKSLASRQT